MKIALAQIDAKLGDMEGICARIAVQAELAAARHADLLCLPAPLLCGIMPGMLVESPDFENDLVKSLEGLARVVCDLGVACLVPAAVASEGGSFFELFLLREGRVAPLRSTMFHARQDTPLDPWLPPVFDIAGTRVAVTFDFARDITELPPGCDLLVYFQVNPFVAADILSAPAAAAAEGAYRRDVQRAGVWMACMAPVGGFDEAVYTGGSFVMDDAGRMLALAPSFEEALIVQEVARGIALPALADHDLPAYNREEWLWEALRLHLRDALEAESFADRALVPLSGDLPSSLLAALAVDAVGPMRVVGLLCERPDALTPAEEAREDDRRARAREVARRLNIRLVEHGGGDAAQMLDRPLGRSEALRARHDIEALYLADAARTLRALPLSPGTKTAYALAARAMAARVPAALAPFGDVYLTELEFLARARNRVSPVLPAELVTLNAVEDAMDEILAETLSPFDSVAAGQLASTLHVLEPSQIDGLLERYVDRNLALDVASGESSAPAAARALAAIVRLGEASRRRLPSAPVVSARSFAERAWPCSLDWFDAGCGGEVPRAVEGLVSEELVRLEEHGERYGERMRDELIDLAAGLLGIPVDQLEGLSSPEGQDRLQEGLARFQEQLRDAFAQMEGDDGSFDAALSDLGMLGSGARTGGSRFFSQN